MKNWRKALVPMDISIADTMVTINSCMEKIALIVDKSGKLIGSVTDGDIRRGLLRGLAMDSPALAVCNRNPLTATPETSKDKILRMMRQHQIRQIPVVDSYGIVLDLILKEQLDAQIASVRDATVVLMAGGKGARLRPLTENTPKPMLHVGGKPLLERILENLSAQGFGRVFLSIHYKADVIKDHFGDGGRWGLDIQYLEETVPMGTAGAIGLLPTLPAHPILVMNGDLLTKVDFGHLIDFHLAQGADATMGVREYDIEIDYGVVEIDGDRIVAIKEKPVHQFLVNAGIYVLGTEHLADYLKSAPMDMPALFQRMVDDGLRCSVFPIVEYWLDIGRRQDFELANDVVSDL